VDPLPAYLPPYEGPTSNTELAQRYPLAMISPPARNFLNSSFVNVQSLRDTEGEPALEMHPVDAATRGIAEGDQVRVFNDRGEITWWLGCPSGGKNSRAMARTPTSLRASA
jgi:anaerobic selenocysteine-containing dehydrogenase